MRAHPAGAGSELLSCGLPVPGVSIRPTHPARTAGWTGPLGSQMCGPAVGSAPLERGLVACVLWVTGCWPQPRPGLLPPAQRSGQGAAAASAWEGGVIPSPSLPGSLPPPEGQPSVSVTDRKQWQSPETGGEGWGTGHSSRARCQEAAVFQPSPVSRTETSSRPSPAPSQPRSLRIWRGLGGGGRLRPNSPERP